jgi:neutral ceramidase
VSALVRAQAAASRSLAPAELVFAREDWPQGPARARSEGAVDPQFVAIRLQRPHGNPIATIIDYSMHPTSAPRDVSSADWPGATATHFSEPLFVLQGAVGNSTYDRALDTDALGRAIAVEAQVLLAKDPEPAALNLSCSERAIDLPPPRAPRNIPWPLRRAYANLLAIGFAPSAVQTELTLGPISLLGVPGEPVGAIGLALRPKILVSLSNGYAGYVETPEHWDLGSGESPRTYFGPDLAHTLGFIRP